MEGKLLYQELRPIHSQGIRRRRPVVTPLCLWPPSKCSAVDPGPVLAPSSVWSYPSPTVPYAPRPRVWARRLTHGIPLSAHSCPMLATVFRLFKAENIEASGQAGIQTQVNGMLRSPHQQLSLGGSSHPQDGRQRASGAARWPGALPGGSSRLWS